MQPLAVIAWLVNPVPVDTQDDAIYRILLSAFWPIGLLVETGNLSAYSCGY